MTSRLKRKLDNMGVDLQSNSPRLTENFCLIGTPLPPLEKSKDTGEFVPIWQQEVRDEKGRRRLHGAFTGGFSAGYFNTVGSKEGWAPSTFISSRKDRANKKEARPEDFMDEEDLAEIRESRKLVDTTEETDLFGGTQAELARRGGELEKDSIATAIEALLPQSKDSVGARLLKKMGWRPGQGIGPRITYQQLRALEGNHIRPGEMVDEESTKHLYAPRDTKPVLYLKKENAFGLGYVPGQGLDEIVNRGAGANNSGPILSAGFGLGALNEAEDDDIDVYDGGASREHRHMAYEAGEADDDERILLGGKSAAAKKAPSKAATTSSATFRDGRPIVSGFVLAGKPLIEDRWFPLPEVPKSWKPDPRRVWATDPSAKEIKDAAPSEPQDHRPWMRVKTADERGSMLGETPLPQAPRSVFDYLSQKDRDRLKNLAAGLASGTPLSALPVPPPPTEVSIEIPITEHKTAQAALKGFQPFIREPEKHLRYTTYLNSQANPDAPAIKPLPGQTNAQFNKEVADYAKAAQIFKPISGAMAGRFATASTVEVVGNIHQGLYKPSKEDYAKLDEAKEEEEKKEDESPKAHAARMNMFGLLTRETRVWQPARLLLKRFGVKDPYPDGVPSDEPAPSAALAKTDAWQAEVMKAGPSSFDPPSAPDGAETISKPAKPQETKGRRDLANIGLGEDEEQGKDTLTYERPSKDIFKAIFASDDEDSDDEGEEKPPVEDEPPELPSTNHPKDPVLASPPIATTSKAYEATTSNAPVSEKVDLATFKPTFVPKAEREERKKGKDKDKKDKKDKKKKGKLVVSFEVEDEVEEEKPKKEKDRPRKRHRGKEIVEEDDENMWVEKSPPEIVKDLVIPIPTEASEDLQPNPRGRKRAVDFL